MTKIPQRATAAGRAAASPAKAAGRSAGKGAAGKAKGGKATAGKPALWEAGTSLDLVLDSLVDHAILTLDLKGTITSWNAGAARVKGYSYAEAIGRNFGIFYTPEDQAVGLPARVLQLALEHGRHESDGWRVRSDGTHFWASVVVRPFRDNQGRVRGFVKVTRDISEHLQIEKMRDELMLAKKSEAISQLTSGVAHEFNNLLMAIEASYHLVTHYSKDKRISRIIDVNNVGIDRCKKLVGQLLSFSREQVLSPKPCNLNNIVSVFDLLMEKALGEAISFKKNLAAGIPLVNLDQGQFQSALMNLVVNARDAMPGRGELTVFTEMSHLTAASIAPPHHVVAGEYVVLGVRDTGVGMSPATLERAVEPFFTTKEFGKGTGLGLSQCYGFARQSGGTMTIESEEGGGTTVRLYFPVWSFDRKSSEERHDTTILLVDDDTAVRSLVAEILGIHGYKVIEADSAEAALGALSGSDPIDCVFTDIVMPNTNGLELIEAARRMIPNLPALFTSGYSREALRNIANLGNDVSFIPKPYDIADVALQISAMTARPQGKLRMV